MTPASIATGVMKMDSVDFDPMQRCADYCSRQKTVDFTRRYFRLKYFSSVSRSFTFSAKNGFLSLNYIYPAVLSAIGRNSTESG